MNTRCLQLLSALGLATCVASASEVEAGSRVFDTEPSTCTATNCSQETVGGTLGALGGGGVPPLSTLPWTLEIFAAQNSCLRLQVTAQRQGADLEAVLVAPNGLIYRNDDSGVSPCTLCPLIKADRTPNAGWYTLQISQFDGSGNFANFILEYGNYNAGNPNCSSPTTPQFVTARRAESRLKTENAESPDAFGEEFEFDPDMAPPAPGE